MILELLIADASFSCNAVPDPVLGEDIPDASTAEGVGFGAGGSTTVRQDTTSSGSRVNPTIRIDQPKLSSCLTRSCWSMIGHITPPIEAPPIVRPIASPRRCGMCLMTTPNGVQKTRDMPAPSRTPCARTNCQYSLQREVMNRAVRMTALPNHSSLVGPNLSTSTPANPAPRYKRKMETEPIHDMSEAE